MNTTKWTCVILVMAAFAGTAKAQTTNTWANANLTATTTPTSLNWFSDPQANWTGGTPVSGNVNTIQFFKDTTTRVANTVAATQASVLDNGSTAFELGTLTLLGLASNLNGVSLIMNLSGDALNFSAATGTVNLNALDSSPRTITYNITNNIQLGTASSASTLTLTGNGTSSFNFRGNFTELKTGGGSKLIKSGTSTVTISGAVTNSGGLEVNGGSLSLTSASNAITGGIALSGSILNCSYASTIDGNNISASGASTLNGSFSLTNATITLNSGANLTFGSNGGSMTISTPVTGDGAISINRVSSSGHTQVLSSTANTFTGTVSFTGGATLSLSINSLADSASLGAGNIRFAVNAGTSAQTFALGSGAIAPLMLNNRRIELVAGSAATYSIANNSSQAFTINTDLLVGVNTGSPVLTLGGTGTGLSSFNGKIDNGSAPSLGLTKSGTGIWVLGHTNSTYTGVTTISGGTLQVAKLANGGSPSSMGISSSAAANLSFGGGTLRYVGTGDFTDRGFTQTGAGTFDASGTGPLILANTATPGYGTAGTARALTLTGANADTNTLAAALANNGAGVNTFNKAGIGTWVLSGANANTGNTTISGGGKLILDYGTSGGATDNNKIAGVLTLNNGGGDITLRGGSHVEAVTSLTIGTGGGNTSITREVGSTAKIAFGAITRTVSGGVTMSLAEDGLATTTSANANGILTGSITVGSNWAKNDGANNIVGLSGISAGNYTDLSITAGGTSGSPLNNNYQLTGNKTATGEFVLGSLRIVNSANSQTLNMAGFQLRVSPLVAALGNGAGGGILYVGDDGANTTDNTYTITGASGLQAQNGNQELIVNTFRGTLNIDVPVTTGSAAAGLTKTGVGTLVLTKSGTYTGATYVNQGALQLRHATAAGTITGSIFVANNAALELASSVAIGAEALTITGNGSGSNTGALRNVASNTSTYGGVITIGNGGARINSDASGILILASNLVTSAFNDATIGGNGDTTVSGLISGAGSLIKDGTGTLTLSGTNTYSGTTTINGGKLALGGHNVLSGKSVTINNNSTLDAGAYTNTLSTLKVSGSGTIVMSPGAVLAFADSSAIQWGGTLNISGAFAAGTSLRFGTSSAGLTPDQISALTVTGYALSLDANGYLTGKPSGTLISFQ